VNDSLVTASSSAARSSRRLGVSVTGDRPRVVSLSAAAYMSSWLRRVFELLAALFRLGCSRPGRAQLPVSSVTFRVRTVGVFPHGFLSGGPGGSEAPCAHRSSARPVRRPIVRWCWTSIRKYVHPIP
jgi:hypothetical protein